MIHKVALFASFWAISIFISVVTLHPVILSYIQPPPPSHAHAAQRAPLSVGAATAILVVCLAAASVAHRLQVLGGLLAFAAVAPVLAWYWLTYCERIYVPFTRLVIQADEFNQITYKPNLPFKIGIGGFYKWFGLALAFGSPLHNQDEDKQGKTESFDLRLNLYSTSFAIEGYLHRLKGFYASNYEYPDGNNYLNPSLMVTAIGGYGYYVLNNRKFSLRS